MTNQALSSLSGVKLEIIKSIIKCSNTKENENLLYKMLGYVEFLNYKSEKEY